MSERISNLSIIELLQKHKKDVVQAAKRHVHPLAENSFLAHIMDPSSVMQLIHQGQSKKRSSSEVVFEPQCAVEYVLETRDLHHKEKHRLQKQIEEEIEEGYQYLLHFLATAHCISPFDRFELIQNCTLLPRKTQLPNTSEKQLSYESELFFTMDIIHALAQLTVPTPHEPSALSPSSLLALFGVILAFGEKICLLYAKNHKGKKDTAFVSADEPAKEKLLERVQRGKKMMWRNHINMYTIQVFQNHGHTAMVDYVLFQKATLEIINPISSKKKKRHKKHQKTA